MDSKNFDLHNAKADEKMELILDSGLGLSMDPNEEICQPLPPLAEQLESLKLEDQDSKNPIDSCSNLFAQDEDGNSLLHLVIFYKLEDKAIQIVNNANSLDNLNLKNLYGETPLMLAVDFCMYSLVRRLIDCGVDVESVDYKDMNNIVHIAAQNKDSSMLKLIYTDSGCLTEKTFTSLVSLLNATNNKGFVPLHIAVQNQNIDFIKLLMDLQVNIEAQDLTAGYTGLHHAVSFGNAEWVKTYISQCHPCLDALSYAGNTPYQLALLNNETEIMQILIHAGASTDM